MCISDCITVAVFPLQFFREIIKIRKKNVISSIIFCDIPLY